MKNEKEEFRNLLFSAIMLDIINTFIHTEHNHPSKLRKQRPCYWNIEPLRFCLHHIAYFHRARSITLNKSKV